MHVLATAGHVDHGKSTLVHHLTGTDPDRLAEEKRRGLTIDLGFATTTLPSGAEVGFVDVPGHARLIKNMIAGVGAVDACLFVVAATEGWKPQSEEHLRILEVLGTARGTIALTKVGLVDEDTRQLVRLDIEDHVAGTFLEPAEVVAVDVPAGIGTSGVGDVAVALDRMLVTAPTAEDRRRPRLWIDRAFTVQGAGTVVTGTLATGCLRIGDHLTVEPGDRRVRVRGLQSHGVPVPVASPGRRLAVNLTGVAHGELRRGQALVRPGQWHGCTNLDASFHAFADLGRDVGRRGAYLGYMGSGEHPVRLRVLGASGPIEPGGTGFVRLALPQALPLVPGDRYVLRETGRQQTIGGGEVLDVAPVVRAARARPSRQVGRVVAERGWV
ncbi:MAG: selenocysteine-specific translation elongation factor, partial [Acidimicrobiales bacterium]